MTDRVGMRGVLTCRLDLLGDQRDGEDPALELQREELRQRLAELGRDAVAEAAGGATRLPYREEA